MNRGLCQSLLLSDSSFLERKGAITNTCIARDQLCTKFSGTIGLAHSFTREPKYVAHEAWDKSHQIRSSLHQLYPEAQDLDDIHHYAQARTHLFTAPELSLPRDFGLLSGARYVLTLGEGSICDGSFAMTIQELVSMMVEGPYNVSSGCTAHVKYDHLRVLFNLLMPQQLLLCCPPRCLESVSYCLHQ